MKQTKNIAIYLYDEVEVLDFAGPFEVFSTASRIKLRQQPNLQKPFHVFTIADQVRVVNARGGLQVQVRYGILQHPSIDVLIVPGGIIDMEIERPDIITWMRRTADHTQIIASVCTGSFLLAEAGLLQNRTATTHWEDITDFHRRFPDLTLEKSARWVDEGEIVTSGGISAGLDMSLHLVSRLESLDLAILTARQMDYVWQRSAIG